MTRSEVRLRDDGTWFDREENNTSAETIGNGGAGAIFAPKVTQL